MITAYDAGHLRPCKVPALAHSFLDSPNHLENERVDPAARACSIAPCSTTSVDGRFTADTNSIDNIHKARNPIWSLRRTP